VSRATGFSHADIDVNLLSDPKLRAARKRLPDPESQKAAVLTYIAVVLESWRIGERLTVMQALPEWLNYSEQVVAALVAEGLLDKAERVPAKVWTDWYGVAEARREQRRSAGAAGGRASAERRSSDGGSGAGPDRQSSSQTNSQSNSQSFQPRARSRSRGATGQGPERLSDLLPPPPGHPDAE
jgi:hypothetical protein